MTKDPMPLLLTLFMSKDNFPVIETMKTRGRPAVLVTQKTGKYHVTFKLKKLFPGQAFLGIYPAAATLPSADGLTHGDYALLDSGEVLQIL
jgi:hypothetical protein